MATLVLAVVVVGLAAPSMMSLIRSAALLAISNEVVVDIQFARSEAITLNFPVTVCAANTSSSDCINGTDWTGGWIVFGESLNVNGAVDPGETIFRTHTGAGQDSMKIIMTAATNLTNALVFMGNGFPVAPGGLPPSGTLQICDDGDPEFSRNIVINKTGRIESTGEATSCI
jgi:Tfp pilus assembly protein FimT